MANKKVIQKWVDALRSGEYTQGKGRLRDEDDNYCCLGVLCEVYRQKKNNGSWSFIDNTPFFTTPSAIYGKRYLPPVEIAEWLGLAEDNPRVTHEGESKTVADLNDAGFTFAQIADFIENEFLK